MSCTTKPAIQPSVPLRPLAVAVVSALASVSPGGVWALPTGEQVVAGQIAITRPGAASLVVNQTSSRGIVNWQSFSIAPQEWVNFIQPGPSSVILNRVLGNNPSEIFGRLTANGQVFLTNPNGVLFGRSASIDVGGFVASTLSISNQDFMAGQYRFAREAAAAAVSNLGRISAADGGYVALLAPEVRNEGVISARLGTVALGAGERVSLSLNDGSLLGLNVEQAAVNALVENRNLLQADGGRVILSARAADQLVRTVVNNESIIEARSVTNANGVIRLEGGNTGRVAVSGTLDASGRAQGASGGRVEVLGGEIALGSAAMVDASGNRGGGTVLIGGDSRGLNPDIPNARQVSIGAAVTISADALGQGNGGRVIVWSDEHTRFDGSISARGGSVGGDGGFVETSGARLDIGDRAFVSTLAPRGASGTWLLDPNDFTIAASGGNISGATLSGNLGGGNVTIDTATQGSAGNGDILVNDGVSWSSNSVLTLSAERHVNVNAVIAASGDSAGLTLTPNTGALGGSYSLGAGGRIDLTGANPSLSIASQGYTVINSLGVAGDAGTTTLQGMKNGLTGRYALGSNIDASATSGWNSGAGFVPVGDASTRFTGTFDGLGHTITGLTIIRGATDYVGLFGHTGTGSIVRNAGLLDVSITGRFGVGGLAGASLSTISNTYTTGTVLSTDYGVGGLVGRNFRAIANSYSTANVTGSNVGGLVGIQGTTVDSGSITSSHATGNVTGTANYTGGLVGYNYETNTINNSYSTGAVSGVNYVGGLVGGNYGPISNSYSTGSVSGSSSAGGLVGIAGGGTVTNSYWDTETSGKATSAGGGTGKTSAEMRQQATFSGFDFTNNWWLSEGNTRPFLRSEWSTGITNAHQLQLMAMNLGATYTLQSDIDLGPAFAAVNGKYPGMWGAAGFAPVGSNAANFTGTFEGLNRTIGGLTINTPSSPNVGLFGAIGAGATLGNVALTGGSITGLYNVGALAGSNSGGTISNAYAESTVAAGGTEDTWFPGNGFPVAKAGGLVGLNTNGGIVTTSHASGNVSGIRAVGGLVGLNSGASSISFSHATGNVSGTQMIGGLLGLNDFQSANTVSDSYATGSVTGDDAAGGLAGWNGWNVTRSYATGAVSGVSAIGGLLGYNRFGSVTYSYATGPATGTTTVAGLIGTAETGPVQYSYATGKVTGSSVLGGLVGGTGAQGNPAVVTNSFWDSTTTGQTTSTGGGTPKTSAELMTQSTLTNSGWDFTNTWWMADGSTRPFLRSEWSNTITNAHQLQMMGMDLSATYTLANNIDLTGALAAVNGKYPGVWGAAGFAPVGNAGGNDPAPNFIGSFDGLGHTIAGLTINRPAANYVGLFGYTSSGSVVRNVGLVGGSVTGNEYVGGLAGVNSGSTVTDSYSTGTVSSNGVNVGGLVGANNGGTITNSYSTGTVSGSGANVGGLVGYNDSIITNSYSTGAVTGSSAVGGLVGWTNQGAISESYSTGSVTGGDYVGGLAGGSNAAATITNSYSTGAVSGGGANVGGLVGWNWGTITNSYWDTETSGQSSSAGGTPKTSAELMTQSTLTNSGWDFTNTWWMADGSPRPFLRSEWSNTITNAHQLQMMGMDLSASYTLANNIDLTGSLAAVNGKYPGMWGAGGFVPVGSDATRFTGTLDGLGHTLTNLYVNRSIADSAGLFGHVGSGSIVRNVGLVGGSVTNTYSNAPVGGLVGVNFGSISNSYNTGNVSGARSYVGGLVGLNYGTINYSYATGEVSPGESRAGGLVGQNGGTFSGTISNSYATGRVSSGCCANGGLVGYQEGGSSIINSYSTGTVAGSFHIGGLLGEGGGSVTNSFWDTSTSGWGSSLGGTGLTTAQMMQSGNLAGFDFTNVWNIVPGISYPYLRWQFSSTPQIFSGSVTGSGGPGTRIQFIANGASLAQTRAGANGFYYSALPGNSVPDGRTAVSYVVEDAYKGAAAHGSAGSHVTGMTITESTLTIGGGNVSNSVLGTARGSLASTDIPYSVSGGNLAVSSGFAFQSLAGASYTLDGSVTTVNAAQTWGGPVTLTSNATLAAGSGAISIDGAISGAGRNLTLNTTGNVTQSAGISVAGLELLGAGGNYQLTHTSNAIDTLAGNTGTVNFLENSGFAIGTVNTAGLATSGNTTLSTTGAVIQGAPITASGLELLGAGGTFTLTDPGNAIDTLAGNTSTVNFLENSGFAIGTVNTAGLATSGNIILSSTGAVAQSAPISAAGLELLGAGGAYTLTDPANTVSTLAGNTGSINFVNSGSFTVATTHVAKFAYVANQVSNDISVYVLDPATGALSPVQTVAGEAGGNARSVSVHPTGKFAYVANYDANSVSVYAIDQTTGVLTLVETVAAGNKTGFVTIHPSGKFAYANNAFSDSISVYSIDQTTGALSAGTAVATGDLPTLVAIDPTGKFAYVTNYNSNSVSVYSINQSTGALNAGAAVGAGTTPVSVAVDPTGRFAYVTNYGSANVSVYSINRTTGALAAAGSVGAGSGPYSVAIDPSGRFAYVANNGSNNVSVYSIDQATGALTPGTAVAAGTGPDFISVDPTGRFAYATNEGTDSVSVYSINQSTGALSAGTSVAAGTSPGALGITNVNGGVAGITATGDVTLVAGGSGTITITNSLFKQGAAAATFTLQANHSIVFNTSADIGLIGGGGNAINVVLNSDRDASGAGNIQLNAGTVISSNGGNITLGGGAPVSGLPSGAAAGTGTAAAADRAGIYLNLATLDAGAGNVSLRGTGVAGSASAYGIYAVDGGRIESISGAISLTGTGGAGTSDNYGVHLLGAGTTVTSDSGSISIAGQAAGSTWVNIGTYLLDGAVVSSGSGPITINGTGSAGQDWNIGVVLGGAGTKVSSVTGAIAVTGQGGAGSAGNNFGIHVNNGAGVESTGSATITLDGRGAGGDAGILTTHIGAGNFNGSNVTIGGASSTGNITLTSDTASGADSISLADLAISGTGNLYLQPRNAATDIGIAGGAGTFNLSAAELDTIQSGFASITIGRSNGTGAIDVGAYNWRDALTLRNPGSGSGGISISGTTDLGGKHLALVTGGAISQTAAITNVNRLTLSAGGAIDLDVSGVSNTIATLGNVARGGAFELADSAGGLALDGTVGAHSSDVTIRTSGNLTLNAGSSVSASGTGNITLAAESGNFANNAGSTPFTLGTGRWLVYSSDPANDTLGGLAAGNAKPNLYNRTLASNPPSNISQAGNHSVYSYQPTLNVTADDASRVYGDANPALNVTISGLANGDTASDAYSGTASVSTVANATSPVSGSPYAITPSNGTLASDIGYRFSYVNGALTISKAPLTVTADNKTRGYGDANPSLTSTLSGFKNSETLGTSGVSGSASLATGANATTAAGNATITAAAGNLSAGNYNFTTLNNGTLTITKAPLTITADDKSKTYGAPDPALSASYSAFKNGETSSVVSGLSLSAPSGAAATAGTHPISASGAVAANYDITAVNGTLTVDKAALTIAADDKAKNFGSENPPLSASFSGLRYLDTGAVALGLQLATPVTLETDPGAYPITASGANPLNYSVIYRPGLFAVAKTPLTIRIANATRVEGTADPKFTITDLGYVLGQDIGDLSGSIEFNTSATRTSPPGKYAISASGLTSGDYDIRYQAGELTITPSISEFTPMPNPAIPEAYTAVIAHVEHVQTGEPSALPGPARVDEDSRARRRRLGSIFGLFGRTAGGAFDLRPLIDLNAGGINLPPGLGIREPR